MKITDTQLHIKSIIGVYKGKIPPSSPKCKSRHSDCFVYVLSGEAEYVFKNRTYLASSGDIIYLSADSVYSINVTDENYAFIYVDFVFENDKNTVFKNGIYKSKSLLLLKSNFENLYRLWNMGGHTFHNLYRTREENKLNALQNILFKTYTTATLPFQT